MGYDRYVGNTYPGVGLIITLGTALVFWGAVGLLLFGC